MNLKTTTKAQLIAKANDLGVEVNDQMTKAEIAAQLPVKSSWVNSQMHVTNPALHKEEKTQTQNKELSRYVCLRDNAFRTGMTEQQLEDGKALVRKLGLAMPKIPEEYDKGD